MNLAFVRHHGFTMAPASITSGRPRVAMVIGIADYAVSKLRSTVKDAWDMAYKLKHEAGFKVFTAYNPDRNTLLSRLEEFKRAIPDNSIVIFYYSGHGMVYRNQHYMMTPSYDLPAVNEQGRSYICGVAGVSLEKTLTEVTHKATGGAVVALLDMCRSRGRSVTRGVVGLREADKWKPLAVNTPHTTELLKCYACGYLKTAIDGATNGMYTKHLLQHLFNGNHPDFFEAVEAANLAVVKETSHLSPYDRQKPELICSTTTPFRFKLPLQAAAQSSCSPVQTPSKPGMVPCQPQPLAPIIQMAAAAQHRFEPKLDLQQSEVLAAAALQLALLSNPDQEVQLGRLRALARLNLNFSQMAALIPVLDADRAVNSDATVVDAIAAALADEDVARVLAMPVFRGFRTLVNATAQPKAKKLAVATLLVLLRRTAVPLQAPVGFRATLTALVTPNLPWPTTNGRFYRKWDDLSVAVTVAAGGEEHLARYKYANAAASAMLALLMFEDLVLSSA